MATDHTVQQGEHLTWIASHYGFLNYDAIWSHPANAGLRKLRQNPDVLLPGDKVHIPDKRPKVESCPTGRAHRFKVPGGRLLLRLAFKDFDNQALANAKCEINVDGAATPLKTDANGRVEVPISPAAKEAVLVFKDPLVPLGLSVPIKIGHLDPVDSISGQKARLSNLGYITRPLEEVGGTLLAHVVDEFQCDSGLPRTGICDAATMAKLKEQHGS